MQTTAHRAQDPRAHQARGHCARAKPKQRTTAALWVERTSLQHTIAKEDVDAEEAEAGRKGKKEVERSKSEFTHP